MVTGTNLAGRVFPERAGMNRPGGIPVGSVEVFPARPKPASSTWRCLTANQRAWQATSVRTFGPRWPLARRHFVQMVNSRLCEPLNGLLVRRLAVNRRRTKNAKRLVSGATDNLRLARLHVVAWLTESEHAARNFTECAHLNALPNRVGVPHTPCPAPPGGHLVMCQLISAV